MIYLDNHSVSAPCSSAIDRMLAYLKQDWAASSSCHQLGQEVLSALDARYPMIYDLVEAAIEKDQFVFTSSGAEAVNQVFFSVFLERSRKEGKTHFIVSCLEDAPTLQMAKRLEELGCTIKIAPADPQGRIDVEKLSSLINPRTALISMTMADGITGVIQPFEEIQKIALEKQVLLHLDATYVLGKIPVSFRSDYLTFSGDRIHSVKGSGGLFAKKEAPLAALILGGSEQKGLRGANFDVPSFMALSAAAQQSLLYLDTMALEINRLRNLLEEKVKAKVLFQGEPRLPNTTLLSFDKIHQETLLYYLNRKGVYATIGGSYLRFAPDQTAISFALSRMTTEEEIVKSARIINETVEKLQPISERL